MKMRLLTLIAASTVAHAQLPSVASGTRIRVHAPTVLDRRSTGTLLTMTSDSLAFTVVPSGGLDSTRRNLPVAALRQLDVSRGSSHRQGAKRGATYGFVAGVAFTGAAVISSRNTDMSGWGPGAASLAGAAFTVGSTSIGALIGSAFSVEGWQRIYPAVPPPNVTRY